MDYWDTSALFKLYAQETDSEWFSDYAKGSGSGIYSSDITAVEIVSALYRQFRAKNLNPAVASKIAAKLRSDRDAGFVVFVECSGPVVDEAQRVIERAAYDANPVMIRGMDAIHVASALVHGAGTIVATDDRVRTVAARNGLKLIPG
jgi:uncharacterized protein